MAQDDSLQSDNVVPAKDSLLEVPEEPIGVFVAASPPRLLRSQKQILTVIVNRLGSFIFVPPISGQ